MRRRGCAAAIAANAAATAATAANATASTGTDHLPQHLQSCIRRRLRRWWRWLRVLNLPVVYRLRRLWRAKQLQRCASVATATVHRLEPVRWSRHSPKLLRWYVFDALEFDVP